MIINRESIHLALDAVLDSQDRSNGKYGITLEASPFCVNVRAARATKREWDYYEDFRNVFGEKECNEVLDAIDKLEADTNPHGDARPNQ